MLVPDKFFKVFHGVITWLLLFERVFTTTLDYPHLLDRLSEFVDNLPTDANASGKTGNSNGG